MSLSKKSDYSSKSYQRKLINSRSQDQSFSFLFSALWKLLSRISIFALLLY
uniref:Uncharacterized protein n=1 Tax=Utricularia reniformis TaxID=192314 RepID=A0A1Y0B3B4_9LAMI|nr:hypothetical protein AEK19_MT1760 [Utricularia reniformis]ART31936.1 hypothetical protein AEK19_MT1760 [Utricularia reniformis]